MFNCSLNKNTGNGNIVLQIGKLQITDYEVEKNIKLYQSNFFQKTGRQPNENEFKQWEKEFVDRAYFIANAYDKGYDSMLIVNKKVSAMEHYIVSQPGGLFEQKIIEDSLGVKNYKINSTKRIQILDNYRAETKVKSQASFNNDLLSDISKIIASDGSIHEFDKGRFAVFSKLNIVTFKIEGSEIDVSCKDFMEYYNELPMRHAIGNINQLRLAIDAMVQQEYNYRQAEKIGITVQPKFILDRDNFKKNVVYSMYENNEIKKGKEIGEPQLKQVKDAMVSKLRKLYTVKNKIEIHKYFAQQ